MELQTREISGLKPIPVKHHYDENNSEIVKHFKEYGVIFQQMYDKQERLYKLGRDVTRESKRIITLLLTYDNRNKDDKVIPEVETKLNCLLNTKYLEIAKEAKGEPPYTYYRAYSDANQEFVEAISLYEFLKMGKITGISTCVKKLTFPDGLNVFLSTDDYLLGLFDFSGELMRYTFVLLNTGNVEEVFKICNFMRRFYASFLHLRHESRAYNNKINVLYSSLLKIEKICYNLYLRASEMPIHLLVDIVQRDNDIQPD